MAPPVQYYQQYQVLPAPANYPNYSYSDPYSQNPYSVLKLFQPPPQQQPQIQHVSHQVQGINRVNRQQRVKAPEKMRSPQMNVVNRPVIERLPVTEVDIKKLEADIRRK